MTNIQNALSGLTDITSALYLKSLKSIDIDENDAHKINFNNENYDSIGYIKFSNENDISIITKETTNQEENQNENQTPLLATVNNINSTDNISGINITFNYTNVISTLVTSGFIQANPSGIITGTLASEYIIASSGIITGDFIVKENLYLNDINVNQTLTSKVDKTYLTGDFYNEITGKCTYLSGTDIKIQNNVISIDYTHANQPNKFIKLDENGKISGILYDSQNLIHTSGGTINGDFIVKENLYINDLNVNQTLTSKVDKTYLTGDFYNEITGKCTYLSGTDIKIQNNVISIDYTNANTANRLVQLNISGKIQNTLIEAMPIIQLDPTITNTITPLNNTMYAITPIANSSVEFTNPTNLSSTVSFQLMITNTTPAVSWELKSTNIIWADDDGYCAEANPAPDISQDGMTYVLVFASPRQNVWFGNKSYNFL